MISESTRTLRKLPSAKGQLLTQGGLSVSKAISYSVSKLKDERSGEDSKGMVEVHSVRNIGE